jgi:hypothetical protein
MDAKSQQDQPNQVIQVAAKEKSAIILGRLDHRRRSPKYRMIRYYLLREQWVNGLRRSRIQ